MVSNARSKTDAGTVIPKRSCSHSPEGSAATLAVARSTTWLVLASDRGAPAPESYVATIRVPGIAQTPGDFQGAGAACESLIQFIGRRQESRPEGREPDKATQTVVFAIFRQEPRPRGHIRAFSGLHRVVGAQSHVLRVMSNAGSCVVQVSGNVLRMTQCLFQRGAGVSRRRARSRLSSGQAKVMAPPFPANRSLNRVIGEPLDLLGQPSWHTAFLWRPARAHECRAGVRATRRYRRRR